MNPVHTHPFYFYVVQIHISIILPQHLRLPIGILPSCFSTKSVFKFLSHAFHMPNPSYPLFVNPRSTNHEALCNVHGVFSSGLLLPFFLEYIPQHTGLLCFQALFFVLNPNLLQNMYSIWHNVQRPLRYVFWRADVRVYWPSLAFSGVYPLSTEPALSGDSASGGRCKLRGEYGRNNPGSGGHRYGG